MTVAAKRAKSASKPVLLRATKLVDPATGEIVGAFIPANGVHAQIIRERQYKAGDELRAELRKPRNPKFLRLVHALGRLMCEQVDGFELGDAHDALKRLQREAGICCDTQEIDLGPLGKVTINVARSMSFDAMDESEFSGMWKSLCDHVGRTYLRGMDAQAIEDAALMMAA